MELIMTINLNEVLLLIAFVYVTSFLLIEIIELATFEELYMGEYIPYCRDILSCFKKGCNCYGLKMILRLPIEAVERFKIWMKYNG